MSDRRELQPGDRAAISEADIAGRVDDVAGSTVYLTADDGAEYVLPAVLVSWLPPADEPELNPGDRVRNADDPDDIRRWSYLPSSSDNRAFVSSHRVADKDVRMFWDRGELPRRIEKDN